MKQRKLGPHKKVLKPKFKVGELVRYIQKSVQEFKENPLEGSMPWDFPSENDINLFMIYCVRVCDSIYYELQNMATGKCYAGVNEENLESLKVSRTPISDGVGYIDSIANFNDSTYTEQIETRERALGHYTENGWEYWLEQADNGLILKKKCKHCNKMINMFCDGRVSLLSGEFPWSL